MTSRSRSRFYLECHVILPFPLSTRNWTPEEREVYSSFLMYPESLNIEHAEAAEYARGLRADFPILATEVRGKPLVFFDSAASSQKVQVALDAERKLLTESYANIHRGVYALSEQATAAYEDARFTIAEYLDAARSEEVVFTRGTTESINLVANSFGGAYLNPGDAVLVSELEHHANIVPWQMLAEELGLEILRIPVTESGEWDLSTLDELLDQQVAMISVSHVSNSLGTINPVETVIAAAKSRDIPVLLDGAQAIPHFKPDVQSLDCDFYVFSGHKLFGPTGIGVLYGKYARLEAMPPYQGGGDMIDKVSFDGTTFAKPPARFEAGTPHISGAVGLAAAVRYVSVLDAQLLHEHEQGMMRYLEAGLREIEGLRIYGEAADKVSVTSFVLDEVHPHDMATFLDSDGICIRAGHHCCQPLMSHYGIAGTARASLAFYNTFEEVDAFLAAIHKIKKFFG